MYENYLLCPEAIAEIANQQEGFRDQPLTTSEIKKWIESKQQKGDYLPKNITPGNLKEDIWLQKVNGAKLLSDFFAELSESRVSYSKTKHSYELTEWLVKYQPEQLSDLATILKDIIQRSPQE